MKRIVFLWFVTAVVVTGFCLLAMGQDEYWTPAGAPLTDEGKMKTLEQVEPRTPITGLPFTISNPGSYYLIHSLNGVAGSNGIIIAASEVQLDLNGFCLFGGGGSNTHHGIYIQPSAEPQSGGRRFSISIRNGSVMEWGWWGINATNAHQSEFINMKSMMNGGTGIGVGESCLVVQCSAGDNTQNGIMTQLDATITDCKSIHNGNHGIITSDGTRISGCTAIQNAWAGIIAQQGVTIMDCKACGNGQNGVMGGSGNRISGCTMAENKVNGISVDTYCTVRDCLAVANTNNGIVVTWSCLVTDNNCGNNGKITGNGSGILVMNSGNRIENNSLTANYNGIEVRGEGNWIANNTAIDNECYGIIVTNGNNMVVCNAAGTHHVPSGTNYMITANNNQFGAIRPYSTGSFTSTNAWANFTILP